MARYVKARSKKSSRSSARDNPAVAAAIARLAKQIKELRGEKALTQEAAAERAKLDVKHWQDLEAGKTNPTMATLVGVAKSLGVGIERLFSA
ncbi:MAG TPA: helix-turn-helix transcriptional regulator [Kofleriaceae bacterium]